MGAIDWKGFLQFLEIRDSSFVIFLSYFLVFRNFHRCHYVCRFHFDSRPWTIQTNHEVSVAGCQSEESFQCQHQQQQRYTLNFSLSILFGKYVRSPLMRETQFTGTVFEHYSFSNNCTTKNVSVSDLVVRFLSWQNKLLSKGIFRFIVVSPYLPIV